MRIFVPTIDYPPIEGGIATVALHLTRELARLGHEVTVLAPALRPGNPQYADMADFDAFEPVRVVRFSGYERGWLRVLPFLNQGFRLAAGADLVLAINVAYGGLLGLGARLRWRTPYVTFAYAYEFMKWEFFPARPLFRTVYRCSATTIAISHFTQSRLAAFGVPRGNTAVVLPGAAAPRPVPDAVQAGVRARFELGGAKMVLSAGRFIPRKNQVALVQAWPRVLDRCPNAHLVLVGRGPTRETCLEKARAFGIEGQVHCPGYVDDATLAGLYAACDVFALPCGQDEGGQVEGFGLVFCEAQAHGKPVVAGRSGGVADAVRNRETGLLVDPGNVDALADALSRLLNDEARAREMGEAGRRRVEEELNWTHFTGGVLEAAGFAPEAPSP